MGNSDRDSQPREVKLSKRWADGNLYRDGNWAGTKEVKD